MIGNFGGFGLMGTILSTLIAAVVGARWLGNDNTSTATASATASQPRAQGQGQQQQQAAAPEQRPVIARFTSEDVERVLAEPNAARDKVRFAKIAGNGGVALQPVAADGSGPQNHTQSVALIEKIQQQCARAGVKGGLALLAPDAQGNHGMVCTPPVVAATPQAAPSRS
jgi:hypothetical protein